MAFCAEVWTTSVIDNLGESFILTEHSFRLVDDQKGKGWSLCLLPARIPPLFSPDPETISTATLPAKRIGELDGLRCLLSWWVVIDHIFWFSGYRYETLPPSRSDPYKRRLRGRRIHHLKRLRSYEITC